MINLTYFYILDTVCGAFCQSLKQSIDKGALIKLIEELLISYI